MRPFLVAVLAPGRRSRIHANTAFLGYQSPQAVPAVEQAMTLTSKQVCLLNFSVTAHADRKQVFAI